MAASNEFYSLCKRHGIGDWKFDTNSFKTKFILTRQQLNKLFDFNIVFDGTLGGLVLGNSHSEGGIHMLQHEENDKFVYSGEMEGWEYVSTPIYNKEMATKFALLNHSVSSNLCRDLEIVIPSKCRIIDTTGIKVPILLFTSFSHFVFNRSCSKLKLLEILDLDEQNYQLLQQSKAAD